MAKLVEPVIFNTLAMEQGYQDALKDFSSEPALESFFSVFAAKKSARTMPKFDREKLKTQSAAVLERVIRNLSISLDNWRHDFHNQFNDALKYIMDFNAEKLKLCNADFKRLTKRHNDIKKTIRDRGISAEQRDALNQELMTLESQLDDLSARIKSLMVNFVIPEQMGTAFNRVMSESNTMFAELIKLYGKYQSCLDSVYDPSDLRYGTMKMEKLSLEMESIVDTISAGSEYRRTMNEKINGIQNLVLTQIYNQNSEPQLGTGMEIPTQNAIGKPLIQTYDKAMALHGKARKRVKELTEEIYKAKKGEQTDIPISMIVNEIVFIMSFFNLLADLLTVYFSAPLSIAKSKAK